MSSLYVFVFLFFYFIQLSILLSVFCEVLFVFRDVCVTKMCYFFKKMSSFHWFKTVRRVLCLCRLYMFSCFYFFTLFSCLYCYLCFVKFCLCLEMCV